MTGLGVQVDGQDVPIAQRCILLVDDEPLVRMATAVMLEDEGFRVVQAKQGDDALAILRGPDSIDLLITDQRMPNMTGLALINAARKLDPGLRVLLMTGLASRANELSDSSVSQLGKPFDHVQMKDAIAAVFGDPIVSGR